MKPSFTTISFFELSPATVEGYHTTAILLQLSVEKKVQSLTSNCGGASAGSVLPKAKMNKCAAYLFIDAGAAIGTVPSWRRAGLTPAGVERHQTAAIG